MRTILLVCRSPSGCWHEHRHCQYRYGLRSQYGEYLGFGAGCSPRGRLSLPPPPPRRSGARGRAGTRRGLLPRSAAGKERAASQRVDGMMGGGGEAGGGSCSPPAPATEPGAPGRQGGLLRPRSPAAARPRRLAASKGAPCRPRARTAPRRHLAALPLRGAPRLPPAPPLRVRGETESRF